MPLRYHPDTGIPSYEPDFDADEFELTEGVTPKPLEVTSKKALFAGDRSPWHQRKLKLTKSKTPLADAIAAGKPINDTVVDAIAAEAKPAKLDANVATDSEIAELEAQVKTRQIKQWPLLRRLLNRLRIAEGG